MVGFHERNLNVAPDAVDDLVLLLDKDINERGIVNDLGNRYKNDEIYTYIGPVLLSVNPFKDIRGFYTEALMQEYYGKYKFELAPHVFATAEEAHRKLMATGLNQCVLISGESGAGKTEAAKKVMEYVSKVSSDTSEFAGEQQRYSKINRSVTEIKDSLLKSNPVLEAFGNAKTIRNDNSSRFGKYMEIQMDYNGVPLGGKITNYLLEKPRVVNQGKGERNFHIFYQLTNGMNERTPTYQELNLKRSEFFRCLCDDEATQVKTIDDVEWFEEMDEAMAKVGIDQRSKMDFFKVVSAVLWLGNISFGKTRQKGQDACEVTNIEALRIASQLLSVQQGELAQALTTRSRETTIDKVRSPLVKVDECEKVRDALCKAIYQRMFKRLVEMINTQIFTPVSEFSLGVLDIYGFEIFENNSFEQLCINFCNEKLQQYFIQLTLQAEQEEYAREGIPWRDVDYFNNKIVCDLVESKRPPGIIAFLDEQITLNRDTDSDVAFLSKMAKGLNHPHFAIPPSARSTPTQFIIRHYAGDVTYDAEGMVNKNKDTLFRDLLVLGGQYSRSPFIQSLFPEGKEKRNLKRPVSAGTQFVGDMNALIQNLEKCEPHYIRCIKPNDRKASNFFNEDRVLHQVKYLGLLENVKVRRAGYAFRQRYDLFVRRYKMLSDQTWPIPRMDDNNATRLILQSVGLNPNSDVAFGKTKLFVEKPESLFTLEKRRAEKIHDVVRVIQTAFRNFRRRLLYLKIRQAAMNLLHGKKRRTKSWIFYYQGDYVNAMKNPDITSFVNENNEGKIHFADRITLYNLNGKKMTESDPILLITQKSFVIITAGKKDKPTDKKRIPFDTIQTVALSTFADNFVILNVKPQVNQKNGKEMLMPSILMQSVKKSEIATVVNDLLPHALQFQDNLSINVTIKKKGLFGKAKTEQQPLVFREDGGLTGRGIKNSTMLTPLNRNKKDPGFNPEQNLVLVASKLGSGADLQLDAPIPDKVIAHTNIGRQGKKRMRRRRRGNY